MKRIFIMFVYVISLLFTINAFAISPLTKAPTLIGSTATTLNITWEKNQNAIGYYVYYSKDAGKNYISFGDAFSDNNATITNLQPNTTYYIVITSFDSQNNESFYSPEGVFNTKTFSEKFGLTDIKTINFNELELLFNASLDSSDEAIREFKITQNNKEIASVDESNINEDEDNKLNLILNKNLSPGEYKLTIIYITDKTGRNIEEGIDGETKFIVPASFNVVTTQDNNVEVNGELVNNLMVENDLGGTNESNISVINANNSTNINANNNINEEDIELNSANENGLNNENIELNSGSPQNEDYGLAGKNMTGVLSTSEEIVSKNKKLPQSGPESIFILFMALILSGFILYFKKRSI